MTNTYSDITFVVTTYRRAEALRNCVASVKAAYPDSFLIVVNDDPSSKKMDFIGQQITYVQNAANLGCPKSRNIGAELVKTPFIFFLDDDATIGDVDLSVAKQVLARDETVAVCGFPARNHINGDIYVTGYFSKNEYAGKLGFDTPAFNGGACLVRTTFFLPRGYHPRIDGYGEEAELTLRAISTGFRVVSLANSGAIDHFPTTINREMNLARQRSNDIATAFEYGGLLMGARQFAAHSLASLKLRRLNQFLGCLKGIKSGLKIVNYKDGSKKIAYRHWLKMAREFAISSE